MYLCVERNIFGIFVLDGIRVDLGEFISIRLGYFNRSLIICVCLFLVVLMIIVELFFKKIDC